MTRNMKIVAAAVAVVALLIGYFALRGSKTDSTENAADQSTEGSAKASARGDRKLPNLGAKAADGPVVQEEHVECKMEPCGGPVCDKCVNENCPIATTGCQSLTDAKDRRLCEDLYACFTDPAHDCTNQGDPLKCWCGTNPTTCITDNKPPTQANGVCAELVFAAAKTTDAAMIKERFVDPQFPLGLATNLTVCRGGFCSKECSVK